MGNVINSELKTKIRKGLLETIDKDLKAKNKAINNYNLSVDLLKRFDKNNNYKK